MKEKKITKYMRSKDGKGTVQKETKNMEQNRRLFLTEKA